MPATPAPFTTPLGPGSFPTDGTTTPGGAITPAPATPFGSGSGSGSFGTGSGYAPAIDPYSNSSTSTSTAVGPIRGPELRAATPPQMIQEPKSPALAPGVQTVPDPDALQPARPMNRAPQLLDPRDKTAARNKTAATAKPFRADQRWAVVPAVWPRPEAPAAAPPVSSPYRAYEERSYSPAASAAYDDSGWTSAR